MCRANEKNQGYPSRDYTGFSIPIAMKYYAHRSMDMLEPKFLNNGMDGYVELFKDLCCEFMRSFDESKKYNNYLDF
jgi:hypothetical protein